MSVQDNLSLSKPLDGGGQNLALDVASLLSQLLGAHSVVDSSDSLLDDGTLVQISSHEMRSGTDNLNTTLVSLVVWLGTLERRQETVVDVDDFARHCLTKAGAQDLHVACKHNQIDVVLLDQFQNLALLLELGLGVDGEMMEGNLVAGGQGLKVRVVGNNERNLDGQLSYRLTEQKIVQTVANFGNHDEHAGLLSDGSQLKVHVHVLGKLLERLLKVTGLGLGAAGPAKVDSHEELFRGRVAELLRVQDVHFILGKEAGHSMHDAWSVGA